MRETQVIEQRMEECECPQCGEVAKVHNRMETRLLHGLNSNYAIMYSIMKCPKCGNLFASYNNEDYPPNEAYLPEVKQCVRHLRFVKRMSWTDVGRKMKKDYGLDIALNSIRNWCKEK